MAFPQTPLPVSIQLAPGGDPAGDPAGWTWVDITNKVRVADGIDITQGRADEANHVDPSSCSMTLDNTGGHFCRTNPLGQWYGRLSKNTPIRVRLPYTSPNIRDSFNRTDVNTWNPGDTGDFWQLTGFGGTVQLSDFDVSPATGGTHSVPVASGYRIAYNELVSNHDVEAAVTTWCPMPTGGDLEPGNIYLRGQDDLDGYLCRISISAAGVVTAQIMDARLGTTLTSIAVPGITYTANLKLRIRAKIYVDRITMKVWKAVDPEPAAWLLTATSTSVFEPGWVGVRSGVAAGNTNAKPVVFSYDDWEVTEYVDRFGGNVPEWPPRWDKSGRDVTVPITASGILRRLQQGVSPLESPMRRAMAQLLPADQPKLYYPLEEGTDADVPRSAIPPGIEAQIIGMPGFANGEGSDGSSPIYRQERASGVRHRFLDGWTPGTWSMDWVMRTQPTLTGNGVFIFTNWTGTYEMINVTGFPNNIRLHGQDADAFADWFIGVGSTTDLYSGRMHHYRAIFLVNSPTQYDVFMYVDDVLYGSVGVSSASLGSVTLFEAPCRLEDPAFTGYEDDRDRCDFGHFAVWNEYPQYQQGYVDLAAAATGHDGETASERISRLCAEEGIPFSIFTMSSELVGPQKAATFLELLREAEDADGGVLYEYGFGLVYMSREIRYNRAAELVLDFAAGHIAEPPEPVDDDQAVTNDVLVKRWRGRQARYQDVDTDQRVSKIGRYDTEVELTLASDDDLIHHASWRVHKGTFDDLRWPVLAIDLAARPALVDSWLGMPLFGRIQVANPPAEVGPTQIDVALEGYRERLDPYGWRVWMNCSPAQTWQVFEIAAETGDVNPATGRLDTDGSTLTSGITASATSFSVTTASPNRPWTTVADDLPIDLNIEGEQIRVTAITGAASPQTFTVTRAVNGVSKTHPVGATVALWKPLVLAL